MTTLADALERARAQRRTTVERLRGIPDDQMLAPADWQGRKSDVRTLLYVIADGEQERRVALALTLAALGWVPTEAQRILGLAMEAHGRLRAAVLGLPVHLVDAAPLGEWSVRQTLEHHLNSEQRYRAQVEYTLERHRSGGALPEPVPDDRMPARFTGQASTTGPVEEIMAELFRARQDTIVSLAGLSAADLDLPARYGRQQVDVRYRLHRFAAHEREHTIQVLKTVRAVGFAPSEAQLILGQAEAARGGSEALLLGVPDEVATRAAPNGASIHAILARGVVDEAAAVAAITHAAA